MKRRLIPLLTACLLLAGCSGLPTAREMGDMALLRTLPNLHLIAQVLKDSALKPSVGKQGPVTT